MDLVGLVGVVAALFLVIGLSEPLAAGLRLPYSVILAGVGILIASAAAYFLNSGAAETLGPVARQIHDLPITANVFLYGFLPTLLFQVALGLNLRRMMDDWVPILALAAVAVFVTTATIGMALATVSSLPLAACLLIGSIVSTTDPSAVISIFRNIAAPQRLMRIVEGESLLNDAAAISIFGLFLTMVMAGTAELSLAPAFEEFPYLVAGGTIVGVTLAFLAVTLMSLVWRHALAQVTISISLPYLAYLIAERGLEASGVIGVVTAGLTLNLLGPGRLTPVAWDKLREVWELLEHWAGSLIFVLAALLIPRLLEDVRWSDFGLIATVTLAAIVARALILFVLFPGLALLRLSPRVELPYRVTILWGGLRGAITLALALAVTENYFVPPEIKRLVGILATGFVLFTLIVQGTTLRLLIRRLGLDKLSPLDLALSNQVIAVALQNVREDVAEAATNHGLTHEIVRDEAKKFGERLEGAVREAEEGAEILDRDRITLGLVTLAGREREMILEGFRNQVVPAGRVEQMLSDVDRIIEATRTNGRVDYLTAARKSLTYGRGFRLAAFLQNRLGINFLMARLAADRFEILLNQSLILKDLHGFIDAKIRRIHGKRVADLLHDMLARREEEVDQALDGLRLQFPGYAEELERRFIRRTALRLEEREYESIHADGLIGPELFTTLTGQIAASEARAEKRPALDLALQKTELVKEYPLFAQMDENQRIRLTKALETRYVAPETILIRKGEQAKSVHFIASGAVEIEGAGQVTRLGRGEMFGQFTILSNRVSRTEVKSLTHCTLLSLSEARFLDLLDRHGAMRDAVIKSAEKRGVNVEGLFDRPRPQKHRGLHLRHRDRQDAPRT